MSHRVAYATTYRGLDEGEAMVTATVDDELVGALRWNYYADPPVVVDVSVDEAHRRHGIGTALFETARSHESRLTHSTTLTDDGRAFAASLPR